MHYKDMCDEVRALMVEEVEFDGDHLYLSSWFSDQGRVAWKDLLLEACRKGSDASLALALRNGRFLSAYYMRQSKKGMIRVTMPRDAHETVAESNFSRFYVRALCQLAISRGVGLIGYRAMQVKTPRFGSEKKIGATFDPSAVLADLRATMNRDPQLGMPPGVGSGILVRLP